MLHGTAARKSERHAMPQEAWGKPSSPLDPEPVQSQEEKVREKTGKENLFNAGISKLTSAPRGQRVLREGGAKKGKKIK